MVAGDALNTISWNVSENATSYTVYWNNAGSVSTGSNSIFAGQQTTVNHSSLINGTVYFYRVIATGNSGSSELSTEVSATPLPPPPAVPINLRAASGNKQVSLTWDIVLDADTYIVHWNNSGNVTTDDESIVATDTGLIHDELINGTFYYYKVLANNIGGSSSLSNEEVALPRIQTVALNDTGVITCANDAANNLSCPQFPFSPQDAEIGRDVSFNDSVDGHAGFSFTKLDSSGNSLSASATSWACVKDNITGRVWENKSNTTDLHHRLWKYSWYNPDSSTNGGVAGDELGVPAVANCGATISQCNTLEFVAALNAAQLCGFTDWRLPNVNEMQSIINYSEAAAPLLDTDYFPNAATGAYLLSHPNGESGTAAYVLDMNGIVLSRPTSGTVDFVRAVRGNE